MYFLNVSVTLCYAREYNRETSTIQHQPSSLIIHHCSFFVFQVSRCHLCSWGFWTLSTGYSLKSKSFSKILLHLYKSLNELSSIGLTAWRCTSPLPRGLRFALDETHLVVPRTNRLIGDRSFSVRRSILWSNIPPSIRVSTTVCGFKGTNGRQKTYEIFHLYCIFYSGFMCQTTVIFGITKDWSLVLNTLASWNCFTSRNLFQNGANDMSECLTFETAFCKKAQNFV